MTGPLRLADDDENGDVCMKAVVAHELMVKRVRCSGIGPVMRPAIPVAFG